MKLAITIPLFVVLLVGCHQAPPPPPPASTALPAPKVPAQPPDEQVIRDALGAWAHDMAKSAQYDMPTSPCQAVVRPITVDRFETDQASSVVDCGKTKHFGKVVCYGSYRKGPEFWRLTAAECRIFVRS